MPEANEEGCCECVYRNTCKKICGCLFCIVIDILLCPCKCCLSCVQGCCEKCYHKCCCRKPA